MHILRSQTYNSGLFGVCTYLGLFWSVLGTCTYHRVIQKITPFCRNARKNVLKSSEHTPTSFIHPLALEEVLIFIETKFFFYFIFIATFVVTWVLLNGLKMYLILSQCLNRDQFASVHQNLVQSIPSTNTSKNCDFQ